MLRFLLLLTFALSSTMAFLTPLPSSSLPSTMQQRAARSEVTTLKASFLPSATELTQVVIAAAATDEYEYGAVAAPGICICLCVV